MEGCAGSHFLGRCLREQGHEVRLMPAQYVKPYVKTNKNDYIYAEAIAEAVGRPKMRFVPIKTDDQLDMQSLHRVRDLWVGRRTSVINPDSRTAAGSWYHVSKRPPTCRSLFARRSGRSGERLVGRAAHAVGATAG
jgi:hypothetical protein